MRVSLLTWEKSHPQWPFHAPRGDLPETTFPRCLKDAHQPMPNLQSLVEGLKRIHPRSLVHKGIEYDLYEDGINVNYDCWNVAFAAGVGQQSNL